MFHLRKKALKQNLKVQEKLNIEISDSLAMMRTKFASERTLLAYLRTALALVLAGLTFVKLFEDVLYVTIGLLFIPLGAGMAVFGTWRFKKKQQEISSSVRAYTPTSPVHAEVAAQQTATTDT